MKRSKSIITEEPPKQKLTLDIINKSVIQRAKAAGVDVPAVTEYLLKAITYQPNNGNTRDDVVRVYESLFSKAWRLLAKYDRMGGYDVDVGEYGYDAEKGLKKVICFDTLMGLSICYEDHGNPIEADIPVDRLFDVLYEPTKIIENIIILLCTVRWCWVNSALVLNFIPHILHLNFIANKLNCIIYCLQSYVIFIIHFAIVCQFLMMIRTLQYQMMKTAT